MSRNSLEIRTGRPGLDSPRQLSRAWWSCSNMPHSHSDHPPTSGLHSCKTLYCSVAGQCQFSISRTANVIIQRLICIPNTIAIMQCSSKTNCKSVLKSSKTLVDDLQHYSRQQGVFCFSLCDQILSWHSDIICCQADSGVSGHVSEPQEPESRLRSLTAGLAGAVQCCDSAAVLVSQPVIRESQRSTTLTFYYTIHL